MFVTQSVPSSVFVLCGVCMLLSVDVDNDINISSKLDLSKPDLIPPRPVVTGIDWDLFSN